ncbi:hypothetical protein FRC01_011031 [Tulasnella sp. 417]|nr:hypothetical protein FRC01_011031 [Tulasnella sp. 417]
MDLALPTASSSNPLVPTESVGQSSTSNNEEPPSSFPRAPQTATSEDAEPAPPSPDSTSKKKRPKARDNGGSVPEDPVDQLAVAQANLAAAPIIGVVGYGPGTGGGSGIRRHTPSCDFCKRRKERCVGGPPCQTCANRGLDCTFDLVNKSHFDRKRTKKPSTNDLGAPIVPLTAPKPAKPAEKVPRTFSKRDNVSEVACMFCRAQCHVTFVVAKISHATETFRDAPIVIAGLSPAPMSLPGGSMPFTTIPGAQVTNPSAAAQQAAMAAALPYFNVAWLAQLAALHQTGNPTSMNPMTTMLTVPVAPGVANTPTAVGGSANPGASSSTGTMAHPPMVFPPGYDPAAAAAAFAQAQTAAQVAAVAQSEPVVERSNVPAVDRAGTLGRDGDPNAMGTSPEQQPEDADGEDDDDLDLDDLDDLQGGEKPT